jgi:hypothetical protein
VGALLLWCQGSPWGSSWAPGSAGLNAAGSATEGVANTSDIAIDDNPHFEVNGTRLPAGAASLIDIEDGLDRMASRLLLRVTSECSETAEHADYHVVDLSSEQLGTSMPSPGSHLAGGAFACCLRQFRRLESVGPRVGFAKELSLRHGGVDRKHHGHV